MYKNNTSKPGYGKCTTLLTIMYTFIFLIKALYLQTSGDKCLRYVNVRKDSGVFVFENIFLSQGHILLLLFLSTTII